MSNERLILKAISEVGLEAFYDLLDEKIEDAVRRDRYSADDDYDRLLMLVAKQVLAKRR